MADQSSASKQKTGHQEDDIVGKAYDGRLMRRLLTYLRPYKWQSAISIAAILLIYKGAVISALVIFVLGLGVLTIADHVVRPLIIGSATRLPFLWVLMGILGGVEACGLLGLFLGPAALTILVDLWREAVHEES